MEEEEEKTEKQKEVNIIGLMKNPGKNNLMQTSSEKCFRS